MQVSKSFLDGGFVVRLVSHARKRKNKKIHKLSGSLAPPYSGNAEITSRKLFVTTTTNADEIGDSDGGGGDNDGGGGIEVAKVKKNMLSDKESRDLPKPKAFNAKSDAEYFHMHMN
jgi:hypothetical protein